MPYWLEVEFLLKVKTEEREQKEIFSDALPYYYFEIAQLLLNECKDEFEKHLQVKSLIEDIFSLRKEKITKILKNIDPDTPVAYLSNAGAAEVNYIRPAMGSAYSLVHKMQNVL